MTLHELPGLLDPATGLPRSWRAYVYGMQYMARRRARQDLRMADATAVHATQPEDARRWREEAMVAAGYMGTTLTPEAAGE